MKKTIILGFSLLMLCGCDIGTITSDCKLEVKDYSGDYGDKLTATSYIKAKYNRDGYMISSTFGTIEIAKDDETYQTRKNVISSGNNTANIKNTFDDKNKTITTEISNDIDYSDIEDKSAYNITNYIKMVESSGYKCEIKGSTREKLGLD